MSTFMTVKPTTSKKTTTPTLPKKVKIGPHVYKIAGTKAAWDVLEKTTGGDYLHADHYGLCDNDNLTIYISYEIDGTVQKSVLLHEIIHALNHVYSFTFNGDSIEVKDLDEALARVMSTSWLQLVQDNPQLVSYLTAK